MTDTIDTYAIGERNRQKILDLLRQRGPMTMTQIAEFVNTSIGTVHKRRSRPEFQLARMAGRG